MCSFQEPQGGRLKYSLRMPGSILSRYAIPSRFPVVLSLTANSSPPFQLNVNVLNAGSRLRSQEDE